MQLSSVSVTKAGASSGKIFFKYNIVYNFIGFNLCPSV